MSQSLALKPSHDTESKTRPASRGAKRRSEILAQAEIAFLEQGYEKTSVDDIAARAGASKATLYKYFGSKEALFSEIIHDIVPDIPGGLLQKLNSDDSLRNTLLDWCLHLIERVTTARSVALYRLIVAETTRYSQLNVIHYQRGPETTQKELAEFLGVATEEGKLECKNPDLVARVFASSAFGEPFERALLGIPISDIEETKAYVNQAIDMLEAYCLPQKER